jgi:biopolymer transport protein ExbD
MSQLQIPPAEASKTKRTIHSFPQIDMTPMVDLGFLLISFFIFTTSMTEKTAMTLMMPANGESTGVPESKSLSILLGNKDKAFIYEGRFEEANEHKKIFSADYSPEGIRRLITLKRKQLAKPDDLVVIIKPLDQSSYRNTVDALDEMTINGITRYAITRPTTEEKKYMNLREGN